MKKFIAITASVLMLQSFSLSVEATGDAALTVDGTDVSGLIEQYQDQIKEVIGSMDGSTVNDAFSFMKEKVQAGDLKTEAGMKEAIAEGKEKFGLEVNESYIEDTLKLMNELEDMGFDSEQLIDKAEALYQEYGAEFADHTQELIVDVVKDSIWTMIKNAVINFFKDIGKSIGDFFKSL